MPNVIVLGSEAFERCLSHESGTFMNGISVLITDPTGIPPPFHEVRTQPEVSGINEEKGQYLTKLAP